MPRSQDPPLKIACICNVYSHVRQLRHIMVVITADQTRIAVWHFAVDFVRILESGIALVSLYISLLKNWTNLYRIPPQHGSCFRCMFGCHLCCKFSLLLRYSCLWFVLQSLSDLQELNFDENCLLVISSLWSDIVMYRADTWNTTRDR